VIAPGSCTTLGLVTLCALYFAVAAAFYGLRSLWSVPPDDIEVERRPASALFGKRLRRFFSWTIRPIFDLADRSGLPANAITTLSLLFSLGAGVGLAVGASVLGGWLYLVAGLCDVLDGRLARKRGSAGPAGAALDSVVDRYSDGVVLIGLAWFYRSSWVALVVLAGFLGSLVVPYVRARAEGLGAEARGGLLARPERVVLLGAALALAPLSAHSFTSLGLRPDMLTVGALVLLAVGTHATVLQRLLGVMSSLESAPPRAKQKRRVMAAVPAWLATGGGAMVGAAINFTMNRVWTFKATTGAIQGQALRYSVVSLTSALLNSGGVALGGLLPSAGYQVAWVITRGAVFLLWNYPLQRDYVYRQPPAKKTHSATEQVPHSSRHAA